MYRKWRDGPIYDKPTRIDGKVVIITGCNTGIGKATALELAKRGARLYMACRDYHKCETARQEIMELSGNSHIYNRTLDLSSLQSISDFAARFNQEVERLDILINNAGMLSATLQHTVDGFEQQFAVNHLGHFLLTHLLLNKLKASAPSRIVVVSSVAHRLGTIKKDNLNGEKSYSSLGAYAQSKLANVLFTRKLAKLLQGTQVTVNCLHPGTVQSDIGRYNGAVQTLFSLGKLALRTTKGGAQNSIFVAIDPDIEGETGNYYDRMKKGKLSRKAKDEAMADWLWRQSERMLGLK